MPLSPLPPAVCDPQRLDALAGLGILDTPAEPGFDSIVRLACRLCNTPVALVSLVAEDRQWFKARIGFPPCETDLNSSVCAHALAQPDELLIISDLTTDPRTSDNPLVTGEPFIRFYAGAPLRTSGGLVLGSLCVIDKAPRPEGLTTAQAEDLRDLADQVMSQLELRRAIAQRDALRAAEVQTYRAREALRETQVAVLAANGELDAVLNAVVTGAMRAMPTADGCVIELLDGRELEYRAVAGTVANQKGLRVPLAGSTAGYCATTRAPYLMVDAGSDPHVKKELVDALQLGSAVFSPILRGDTVFGVLKLQSSLPVAFGADDLELARLFAGAATTGLVEAASWAEARAKDAYWRGLFDRLNEGFLVGEVLRDDVGRITDWRYLEINPAWGELLGVDPASALGRTFREIFPGGEEHWITDFAHVVETGDSLPFTQLFSPTGRWYDGRAFKLDGNRFGLIFSEVTQRIEAEARRTALLSLGDRLRDVGTIQDMTRAAAEIVGRTLGASRAAFGRVIGDVEFIDIEPDWIAPGQGSVAGRHRYDDFGNIREALQRGEPLVVNDVATDPRTQPDAGMWQEFAINAFVHMPVRDKGRTVAVFVVHDLKPRVWTPEELAFLRNVADRVEVGVARVQAEELQGVLNKELAHRLKNTLAIVQSIATQTLRGVTERAPVEAFERRILALSRAHDVLMQKSWTAAKLRGVMESVLSMQADLDRFALDGPDMDISAQAALSLSMLLHELATNALKYGSLSAGTGTVRISWRTDEEGTLDPTMVLGWQESGGPEVNAPNSRGGFGSKLIRMGLLGTRDASLRYDPKGLQAEFRAPLADMQMLIH